MWNEETIKKNVDDGQLPCARCHKWKDGVSSFKKGMKTCNDCLDAWKLRKEELAEAKRVKEKEKVIFK